MTEPILTVRNLTKHFGGKKPLIGKATPVVRAVDGISFTLQRGETLGLVGESGCGKTTLGRCIVRALDPSNGDILYDDVNLATQSHKDLRKSRAEIQMIFQDPISSLNPRMTLLEIIGEPLVVNRSITGDALREIVGDLLERVGLRREHMNRYPHAFSGGQRQRIGIARALALNPKIIVCDEPVSALDVSVQAQVLNLLNDLKAEQDLTFLFIAHDLGVVEYVCDRVAVMYVGQIVELAETDALFARPRHPYTEALLSAVPVPDPDQTTDPKVLQGELANASDLPTGCYFHPRCAYCIDRCRTELPQLREVDGMQVRCHRAEELTLDGVAEDADA